MFRPLSVLISILSLRKSYSVMRGTLFQGYYACALLDGKGMILARNLGAEQNLAFYGCFQISNLIRILPPNLEFVQ